MKIKTIRKQLDYAEKFDDAVNAALEEGWRLLRREVLMPAAQPTDGTRLHIMLYAELVMPDEAPAPLQLSLAEMLQQISAACENAHACDETCPLHSWCKNPQNSIHTAPLDWQGIEEVTG